MMKFKLLEKGVEWIKILHQLAEAFFFHNQVSNMLSQIYSMNLIYNNNIIMAKSVYVFIERQQHRSSENNTELSWSSQEASSTTKDYRGQQHRSFY